MAMTASLENQHMKLSTLFAVGLAVICTPNTSLAQQRSSQPDSASAPQQNPPVAGQRAADEAESVARRFSIGVQGGVGLDPEIIDVGVHAAFGPLFTRNLSVRPVFEIGVGEVTTVLGINLDVIYTFPGYTRDTQWIPYVGGGPNFGLSHRSFETEDGDNVDVEGPGVIDDDRNRFDFSDTDFNGGMNFIVGMRKQSGVFFEMKATAWGVTNVRLLAGFNF
jgi:hypothetical protein